MPPKPVRGSRIHILGTAYKRDIDDVRESPALDIILLLKRLGAAITYSDPFVRKIHIDSQMLESQEMLPSVEAADCVVIVTDHSGCGLSIRCRAQPADCRYAERAQGIPFGQDRAAMRRAVLS